MIKNLKILVLAAALAALTIMGSGTSSASAKEAEPSSKVVSTYQVGDVLVTYFAPQGLQNIWGLNPDADEFLRSLNKHFKLVVLGAYGNPEEFLEFVRELKAGIPTKVPKIALFTTTRKMPEKSYVGKSAKKQFDKYKRWFGFATSTSIVAFGFEVKANGVLKKKLGKDLGFSYDLGKYTKVYEKTPSSISVGLLSNFKINGENCHNYLNTTALQIQDKMVFMTLIGQDSGDIGISTLNNELKRWSEDIIAVNPGPAIGDVPPSKAAGAEDSKEGA